MKSKRSRLALVGVLALALSVTVGIASGGIADAKKVKKTPKASTKPITATGTTGAVPQGPTTPPTGPPFTSNPTPFKGTAAINKTGKGQQIANIDVTLSVTGTPVAGGANALGDLTVRISAPNGATTTLVSGPSSGPGTPGGVTGNTITNLNLTDNTPTLTCPGTATAPATPPPPPPCNDPDATLNAPYTGKAQPFGFLGTLKGGLAKGTYTLTAFDNCGTAPPGGCDSGTTAISSWSISVTPTAGTTTTKKPKKTK